MNCRETRKLFVPYLDNEIIPSERTLVQSHLAGCVSCQQELADLAATRNILAQSLQAQATHAIPSSEALIRLQAKLADEAQRPPSIFFSWLKRSAPIAGSTKSPIKGKFSMKTKVTFAALAGLLVITATAAFVPAVREQVVKVVGLFTIVSSGPVQGNATDFPGYLPEFNSGPVSGSGTASCISPCDLSQGNQPSGFTNIYQKGDQFLVYTTTETNGNETLPKGEPISVNGQPGVVNSRLSGQYVQDIPAVTGVDQNGTPVNIQPITINYTNANKLTWMVGNTRYEMLSNLSVEEMQKIAIELAQTK